MKIAFLFLNLVFYRALADKTLYTASDGGEIKSCLKCPPGSYVVKDCDPADTNSTVCGPCPSGRFTDTWNAWHRCKPCRTHCYGINEITSTGCTPDHDIVCGCGEDYWHQNAGTASSKCLPLHKCGVGVGVDKPATNTSDATCIECVAGTNYSSIVSSYEACQPCRDCEMEGYNETKSCTVLSNAECFVPTTSSSTTTETTTIKDDSSEGDKDYSKVVSIVVPMAVIALLIIMVYCGYKFWQEKKKQSKYSVTRERNNSYSNEVFDHADEVNGRSDESSTASSQVSLDNQRPRRRISNLCLRPDVTLENDVFPWISTRLGKRFERICKSLPGSPNWRRISKADIEAAEYKYRSTGGLSDVIAEVLLTWKNKNEGEKNEDELFKDIYSTLLQHNQSDLSWKLREEFAC